MRPLLLLFILILSIKYAYGSDTLKIILNINNRTINIPSERISIKIKTSSGVYTPRFQGNTLIADTTINDTAVIIVEYENYDIETCWQFEPGSLSEFNMLRIELITSKRFLRRKKRHDSGHKENSQLNSFYNFTLQFKKGGTTGCLITHWIG